MSHTLDLLIHPNCQRLDACSPWRVFATANELAGTPLYQLRRLFQRRFGLPPSIYRARFGSGACS